MSARPEMFCGGLGLGGGVLVIAERIFEHNDGELRVQIAAPERAGDDWGCTYRIVEAGKERSQTAYGVDSLQALLLALDVVRVEVKNTSGVRFMGAEDLFLDPSV